MSFVWRWTVRLILLGLCGLLLVQFWFLVHVWYWESHNPDETAFMRGRLEKLQEKDPKARLQHRWVPYNAISNHLKRAIIAAEDGKFTTHAGFDWEAIQKAHEKNRKKGRIVSGGSTITQQLAKNLFLSGERVWWRKVQEAIVTVMIETMWSKRRILEVYLNVIEWGNGVFGAEAAARHHFGVSAAQLTPEQAARLAGMVPSPRRYVAGRDTAYLAQRADVILARMNSAALP